MAIDDHTSRCSNTSSGNGNGGGGGGGGGGNRLSKKSKSNKVPQRGMGVAQLEKIISEEQQHKKDFVLSSNSGQPVVGCSASSIPFPPPLPPYHQSLAAENGKPAGSWGRLWSDGGDHSSEKQNQSQGMRRLQPFHQPCSSSMVNASAGSTSSSSVMSFQIEPPSNQNYCGNNFQPLWAEEEKMVGMKRPYPFPFDDMPIPSFHCKFPSAYSPFSRSAESASCSNGNSTTIEPALPPFRDNPLNLGVVSHTISKKLIDDNQVLTRDFLKLAPPQSKDSTHLSGRVGSNPQPFLTFIPPAAKTQMGHPANSNGDAGESVDLNLKL